MTSFLDTLLKNNKGSQSSATNPRSLTSSDEYSLSTFPTTTPSSSNAPRHLNISVPSPASTPSSSQPRNHSPSRIMEDKQINHTRRRSASIASLGSIGGKAGDKIHKKNRQGSSDHILEADEDRDSDDERFSSANPSSGSDETDNAYSDDGVEDDEETGLTGKERSKRKKRKRRNTLLDQRVAGDADTSKREESIATQAIVRNIVINTILVCAWYLFSISISLYNKWMFKDDADPDKPNVFPFPLFTTCLHQIVQFCLASLVLYFVPSLRPRHDSINPHGPAATRQEQVDPNKPLMTKWFYFTRIGPCGAGNALDIGLGNMSLKFISLTFFTMCKSSALGFVLIFAFLFRLEQPSWRLVGIIVTMTVGVLMMVAGEAAFNTLGFVLVMSSSCASGFRWSLTQILLLRNPATSNPFSTIFFLAPVMFTSLILLAFPIEGPMQVIEGLGKLMEARGDLMGILILLFPGCLAFAMTVSEFALLKRTSVVTLSICGIFKEVVTISAASIVFDDTLTPINITGLIVTIGSIAAYNYLKFRKMAEDARRNAQLAVEDYQPVLSSEPVEESRTQPPPRQTTRHMIRNSLSMPAGQPFPAPAPPESSRASPVKAPKENLD